MKAIIAVPATLALVYRAYSHKSLTTGGIVAAALSAAAHAVHPWNMPFALLVVFFLAGTRVTKIKKDVKAGLTVPSQGTSGGEGPRTHTQVFANSIVASVLSIAHAYQLHQRKAVLEAGGAPPLGSLCLSWGGDLLPIGIIANYAAMAADTFSSELGILSRSAPRLITSPTLRRVPRGTDGGVTLLGLGAGLLGSIVIVVASVLFTPLCSPTGAAAAPLGRTTPWQPSQRGAAMLALALWGALGSVYDSLLGGLFQRSVRDVRSGRIVEGEGGVRVLVSTSSPRRADVAGEVKAALLGGEAGDAVEETKATSHKPSASDADLGLQPANRKYNPRDPHRRSSFGDDKPSRVTESGWDLLDNNDVNFLTAITMSVGAMAIAGWYWDIPLRTILAP